MLFTLKRAPSKHGATRGHRQFGKLVSALALLLALNACSWFQFPGVYRINIQQGNIVTQEMVDQLQLGMTKGQVNYVLGTALVQDSFNLDRWDYYYSLTNSNSKHTERRFTVYFQDDKLVRTEGQYHLEGPPMPDEELEEQLEQLEDLDETFSSNQRAPNNRDPNSRDNGDGERSTSL